MVGRREDRKEKGWLYIQMYIYIYTVCDNIMLTFCSRYITFTMNDVTVLRYVVRPKRQKERFSAPGAGKTTCAHSSSLSDEE